MVAPVACGHSQARGQIVATAAAYTTAIAIQDSSHICDLLCHLRRRWILNPLGEARYRTSWALCPVLNLLRHTGTPTTFLLPSSHSQSVTPQDLPFSLSEVLIEQSHPLVQINSPSRGIDFLSLQASVLSVQAAVPFVNTGESAMEA